MARYIQRMDYALHDCLWDASAIPHISAMLLQADLLYVNPRRVEGGFRNGPSDNAGQAKSGLPQISSIASASGAPKLSYSISIPFVCTLGMD